MLLPRGSSFWNRKNGLFAVFFVLVCLSAGQQSQAAAARNRTTSAQTDANALLAFKAGISNWDSWVRDAAFVVRCCFLHRKKKKRLTSVLASNWSTTWNGQQLSPLPVYVPGHWVAQENLGWAMFWHCFWSVWPVWLVWHPVFLIWKI